MKKIYILLAVAFLFTTTGCAKEAKEESKTCTMEEEGLKTVYKFDAIDNEIHKVSMAMTFDDKNMNNLSKEDQEQFKKIMLDSMGLEDKTYEGMNISFDFSDKMTIVIDADLKKASKEDMKKVGFDFSDTDMSLDATIKDMEKDGATCK